nr:YciI family protein [Bradyrhizobium diazoefficiens]
MFRAKTREEAQQLADNDPFHATGLRRYELFPWQVNEGSLDVRLLFSTGKFDIG